ncbi:MAG: PAS domain S-box protein [Candidatus Aminicenantes bacterium]|nr:PAS domain S-box protein [Candidatus Aminicenantes bacterium]
MKGKKKSDKQFVDELLQKVCALEFSINAVAIFDLKGNLSYVNPSLIRMWGYENEKEVLGRNAVEFWQTKKKATEVIEALNVNGSWIGELVAKRKDGSFFDVQISACMIVEKTDKNAYLLGSFVDITEHKKMEKELQESEEKFRRIFEAIPDLFFLVTREGTFLDFKGKEGEFFVPPEKFLGKKIEDIFPEDITKLMLNSIINTLDSREPNIIEYDIHIKGEIHNYEARILYFSENQVAVFARDITERKRAEKALLESQKRLRFLSAQIMDAQEKERSRLSKELHDQFGHDLALLKFKTRSIKNQLLKPSSLLKKDFEEVMDYIDQIIENVRGFARDLRPAILEDLGLSASLRWQVENFSKQKSVKISLDVDDIDLNFSHGAQIHLYRIFLEALTNVFKHSQAKNVSLSLRKEKNRVVFFIDDDGKGIDTNKVIDGELSENGLGIAIMRERAQLLGGTLEIISQPEKGFKLKFIFPLEKGNN